MPSKRSAAFLVVKAVARLKRKASLRRRLANTTYDEESKEPLLNIGVPVDARSTATTSEVPIQSSSLAPSISTPTSTLYQDAVAVWDLIFGSWLNLLLVCVPLGIYSEYAHWGATATFSLNFLALIPLALILGDVTEDLALRFGEIIGGLLNATFGNVVELILSLAALQKGLYTVVATSLLGSILSNLLLVLGGCFFVGGLFHQTQTFNAHSNRASASLLLLATIGIVVPTAASSVIHHTGGDGDGWVLSISRGTAIVLLACYICYLIFQLHTHRALFEEQPTSALLEPSAQTGSALGGSSEVDAEALEEAAQPMLSAPCAFLLLGSISVTVAVLSEFLTGSIEEVSKTTGLGQEFIGMIVLPIAGNACEHITAVIVAAKNKMDLSLGIALGSSLQIALFAIPFCVIVAWVAGAPFSLNFDVFSVIALFMSVVHTSVVTSDANSNWLHGVTLIAVYVLIAITYLFRD